MSTQFSSPIFDANYHFPGRSLLSRSQTPTSTSIKFSHGPVRKAERAESRRKSAEDFAFAGQHRQAHTQRTPSRQASGRGGAPRDQESGTKTVAETNGRRSR